MSGLTLKICVSIKSEFRSCNCPGAIRI